ncbi:APC family permease [Neisseriaceae bacterium ESL0693]|nr:APC family permease [Neisseriaceae bacterium ESL0693]
MSGRFKRQLSLADLTFIGLGAIFGSGWLFAASHVSAIAGPAGILSWVFAGIAVLLLGLVFCELGAAIPKSGGIITFPVVSHGPLVGYLLGLITVISFTSLVAIEAVAARQYANAWFHCLNQSGSGNPTLIGWCVQLAILCAFFYINYNSIKTFARTNNIISLFKFLVPLLVIISLFCFFKPDNLHIAGFAPYGISGVEAAVSSGGVIFAYLGLTPIIAVAGEVRNPQRTIPFALILSILLSTIMYVLLQSAFLGAVPTSLISGEGWQKLSQHYTLPYHDIALVLGLGWLGYMVVADAIISPSGTGNIFMNSSARVIYAWAKSGTLLPVFKKIDAGSGIPRPALWLTFALSVFWTLPFPSWEALISVVSAALILSYALAPISAAALRRHYPHMARPFRVKWMALLGPLSFVVASLIIYWSGWHTVSWLLGVQIGMFILYLLLHRYVPTQPISLKQQIRSSLWLVVYYLLLILLSWLGSFGGIGYLTHPQDTLAVALAALGIYYWGSYCGLPLTLIQQTLHLEDEPSANH